MNVDYFKKGLVFCIIAIVMTASHSNGEARYLVDFDHGVQLLAPDPYTASASEILRGDPCFVMAVFDVTAGSQLVDSGDAHALQGGESFWGWRGSGYPRSGYHITDGPVIAGNQWTMEFLIKPNWSGVEAILYSIYAGKERIPGSIVNVFPKLYILGSNHKVQWDPIYQSAPFKTLESTTVLQEDQWYHIAITYEEQVVDPNITTVEIYVTPAGDTTANLVASADIAIDIERPTGSASRLTVLQNFRLMDNRYALGSIDELRFSDKVRTPEEFTTLLLPQGSPASQGFLRNFGPRHRQ